VVPHSTRHGAIKAKLNHEGREEHEGQASPHQSLDSGFELGDVELNEQPRLNGGEIHKRQQLSLMNPLKSVDAFKLDKDERNRFYLLNNNAESSIESDDYLASFFSDCLSGVCIANDPMVARPP
jgi:hypothetical protein